MSALDDVLKHHNLKLLNSYNKEAIYSCIAEEIYGDPSKKNIVMQEYDEYIKPSKGNIITTIRTALGNSYKLDINTNITIKQLKDKIHNILNTMTPHQLIYCGKILSDQTIIKSIGINTKTTMILMLKNKKHPKSIPTVSTLIFMHKNKDASKSLLSALCSLYKIRIKLFEYKNKLIISDCYGDDEQTKDVSLILLLKQSNDIYGVLKALPSATVNTNNPKKRKLQQDTNIAPSSKRRKLSFDHDVKFDYKALNDKYCQLQILHQCTDDTLNKLRVENEKLKKHIEEIGNNKTPESKNMNAMNLDELVQLKAMMQYKIKQIEEAEKELIDNTYKCVACMDRPKNISFMDGCTHIAYCDQCEAASQAKVCPICQAPYESVRKMNF